eukprot:6482770-Amphidinium_carterae.2
MCVHVPLRTSVCPVAHTADFLGGVLGAIENDVVHLAIISLYSSSSSRFACDDVSGTAPTTCKASTFKP